MSFLASVQRTGAAPAKSGFLASVVLPNDPAKAKRLSEMDKKVQEAKAAARKANSVGGIVANTAKGVVDFAKNIAVEAGRPIARQVANIVLATKSFDKEAYDKTAREGVNLPVYGNVKPVGFTGKGVAADLKDVVGTGLETSSLFVPATRAGTILRTTLREGALEGARVGAVSGAQSGVGRELQNPEASFADVLSEGAKSALIGAGIGLPLGAAPGILRKARSGSFLSKVTPSTTRDAAAPLERSSTVEPLSPSGTQRTLQPVQSQGPVRTSSLASSVEAQAVEKKLTESFGDLPQYNRVSMADQAQKASKLLAEEPERAKRIALGQEAAPADLHPESVFVALEDHALKAGDVDTLHDLATKSTLSTEATAMGQRIRTLGERDADSPIGAIQDIQAAREEAFTKRTGRKLAQAKKEAATEIREQIKKATPTKETWDSFISSIECNY